MPDRLVFFALVSVSLLAGASAAAAGPGDAVHTLVLDKALPNDRALELHLDCRGARFVRALGLAQQYSKSSLSVDASKLTLADGKLSGTVTAAIRSDGYNPPEGWRIECTYAIDAAVEPGGVRGSFSGRLEPAAAGAAPPGKGRKAPAPPAAQDVAGAVAGHVARRPEWGRNVRVELRMNNAAAQPLPEPGKRAKRAAPWTLPGYANFTFAGGKAVGGLLRGHGGNPINYFEALVAETDLSLGDGRLTGTFGAVSPGRKYLYRLDAVVVGDAIAGGFTKQVDGKPDEPGRLDGTLSDVTGVRPAEALYYVVLDRAVPDGKQLITYLPGRSGAFGAGVGFAGRWNHTFHDIDASGLKLSGGKLSGELAVTMNPDPYVPPDHKPVACRYALQARVADGFVTGTFTGTFGEGEVRGKVHGELRPRPPVPEPVHVNVKLDNGVCDGPPWHRRCYIGFVATRGKATSGSISNNKGGFRGTFREAEIACDGVTLKATIKATVDSSGSVLKGAYTFHLTGKLVGREIVGKVDTELDGVVRKRGTDFMGSIAPVE